MGNGLIKFSRLFCCNLTSLSQKCRIFHHEFLKINLVVAAVASCNRLILILVGKDTAIILFLFRILTIFSIRVMLIPNSLKVGYRLGYSAL
jgi:hypothetical protein